MSNKWYKKPEMVVAFSALLISIITAVVSVYSAYIDRAYARASVWPRLELAKSFGSKNFELLITNSGTGPALIKYAKIEYDGKTIKKWLDIPNIPNFTQSTINTRILSSQNTIKPIVYSGERKSDFLNIDKSLAITLCYCSIYNECWVTNKNNNPQEAESCDIREEDKFLE